MMKRHTKRTVLAALALLMALSVSACDEQNRADAGTDTGTQAENMTGVVTSGKGDAVTETTEKTHAQTTVLVTTVAEATEAFTTSAETQTSLAPLGTKVGNRCFPYTLERCGGVEGTYSITENVGKVTVLNFWGAWCDPCKAELPHFDKVATEMKDAVTVVAVHSVRGSEGNAADKYIAEHYPNSDIVFCMDAKGEKYYNMLGLSGVYPITLVLDPMGVITVIHYGSVDEETLRSDIENAMK